MSNHMVCSTKYWISINAAPEINNTIDCFFLAYEHIAIAIVLKINVINMLVIDAIL